MNGVRRAAVALYGVHRDDREAILSALSVEQQGALRAALIELESLGFARTIDTVLREQDAVSASGKQASPTNGATDAVAPRALSDEERSIAQLCQADSTQLSTVLSGEPTTLIAEVLLLKSWPWADAFVASLPEPRRSQLRAQLAESAPIPAPRAAWLLGALDRRIAATPATPSVQPMVPAAPNAPTPLRAPKWLRSIVWPA
jgi:hypothetical protein